MMMMMMMMIIRWLDGEKAPVPNIGDGESPLSSGLENRGYKVGLESIFFILS